jgi:tetraacyldisaccharide 4'-kinase
MSAQSWLNRVWYVEAKPPAWLLPLEALFGAVSSVRRFLYAANIRSTMQLACPVVVVGNLSVGGTGKTPLVCWLMERLRERGYRPGVVTRGYGGSNRTPRRVQESDDAALVGDEPVLLARRTRAPVVVGRDRPAAAQMLIDAGCDVIVSDDGLQHYALARDCEIVVVDAERGFGNGHLLPAGPLREGLSRLARVDAIVVNGAAPGAPAIANTAGKPTLGMRLQALQAVSLFDSTSRRLDEFAGQAVHAVAGIAHPQRFFNMLRAAGLGVIPHELPDHAAIQASDIEFDDGLAVLMTEKDAVKCAAFAKSQHWYLPVSAAFEAGEGSELLGIVTRLIGEHGRSAQGNHG